MHGGIIMNDDNLTLLHTIAPLSKKQQNAVWKGVKDELQLGMLHKIKKVIKVWQVLMISFLSIIFIPLSPNAQTLLEADTSGWNATLTGKELSITAISPIPVAKHKVCVLWVEKDGKTYKLAVLPDGGQSKVILDNSLIQKLENAILLISIENKNNIVYPKVIEYSRYI
jgi:hypothetical protein